MFKYKKLGIANDFFNEFDEEYKDKLELEKLLVDIACEFINFRMNNNLMQKDLAEMLGMTQAMISKLESGDYNPTVKMLYEISKKLSWDFNVEFAANSQDYNYQYSEECLQQKEVETEEQRLYNERMGLAS